MSARITNLDLSKSVLHEVDSEISNLEWRVVEAAVAWANRFHLRAETLTDDDELYFKVQHLIAAREKVERQ